MARKGSSKVQRGRVQIETIESRVLKGNPLGDPHIREIPVYLPPGYDDSRSARYPVLYLLAGFTGTARGLLNRDGFGEAIDQRMDRLIASGQVKPAIVAMPDAFTRYGGSQYLNSTATGRYEDHVVREVVPRIDAAFRTKADRRHRGLLGKSSGGYGALILAMKHPDLFSAVASHSGDAYFEYGYLPDFPKAVNAIQKYGGLRGFLAAFERAPRKTGEMIGALNIIAMAACYSPDRGTRPGFRLPFDPGTGRIVEKVWDSWRAHDPVNMVAAHAASLRRLTLLYLDAGRRDEYNLHLGARILSGVLTKHRVPHLYEEFDDGHMGLNYRYDSSLPRLSAALA